MTVGEHLVVGDEEPGQCSPVGPAGGQVGERGCAQEPFPGAEDEVGDLSGERGGAQQLAKRLGPALGLALPEQVADQCDLLGTGEDGGHLSPPEVGRRMQLEEAEGEGVEGRDAQAANSRSDGCGDASFEVGGGPTGEGQHQDLVAGDRPITQEVGGPPHQKLRLPGTGARHDDLGAVRIGDRPRPIIGMKACLVSFLGRAGPPGHSSA